MLLPRSWTPQTRPAARTPETREAAPPGAASSGHEPGSAIEVPGAQHEGPVPRIEVRQVIEVELAHVE